MLRKNQINMSKMDVSLKRNMNIRDMKLEMFRIFKSFQPFKFLGFVRNKIMKTE